MTEGLNMRALMGRALATIGAVGLAVAISAGAGSATSAAPAAAHPAGQHTHSVLAANSSSADWWIK